MTKNVIADFLCSYATVDKVATFKGQVCPGNPKYRTLAGLQAHASAGDLPEASDLAIICTLPDAVQGLVPQLGERHPRRDRPHGRPERPLRQSGAHHQAGGAGRRALLRAAPSRPQLRRHAGPLDRPEHQFCPHGRQARKIAFVSQPDALVTVVLDWTNSRGIGFSKFISLRDSVDVNFDERARLPGQRPGNRRHPAVRGRIY